MFFYAVFGIVQRVTILVAYFLPFFGHLDILQHWQAEKKPWAIRKTISYHGGKAYQNKTVNYTTDYLYLADGRTVAWAKLNRASYADPENPTPPSYTLYTGLSLGGAFALFGLILFFHVTTIIVIKYFTVHKFSQRKSLLEMLNHGLENTNLAYPVYDWDHITGNVARHKEASKKVAQEIVLTLIANFLWSLAMLAPIFFTGNQIECERKGVLTIKQIETEKIVYIVA